MATHTPLDHGLLNLPLSKRGNIDSQIARFKADKMRAERKKRREYSAEMKALRSEAKALISSTSNDRFAELAQKCGHTAVSLRRVMRSDAHWQPRLVIKLLGAGRIDKAETA